MDTKMTVKQLEIISATERYQRALNEFKPDITTKTDDGSWRRIIRFPLGVSGNEVKLVEVLGINGNLDSTSKNEKPVLDWLSEMLIEVNFLNPKDPKHKTNPVVQFATPDLAMEYLSSLGDAESFPLGVAFTWLIQSQDLFRAPEPRQTTPRTP